MFKVCGQVCQELYDLFPTTILDAASTGGNNEVKPSALEKLKARRKEENSNRNSSDLALTRIAQSSIRTDALHNQKNAKLDELNGIRIEMDLGIITREQAKEQYQLLKQKYLDLAVQLDLDYPPVPVIDLTRENLSCFPNRKCDTLKF